MSDQQAKYFDLLTSGLGYLNRVREVTPEEGNPFLSIGSEEAAAPVCPQNRAYGSVHSSSRKTDPLTKLKPMR